MRTIIFVVATGLAWAVVCAEISPPYWLCFLGGAVLGGLAYTLSRRGK